jgi:uncharacterized protein (TIGR02246 family)
MTMPQDKATIQKLIDAFAEAFNRGDTASMATMYTEDAYLLPPQADMMRGRAAIQQFWQAASEQIGDMKLTIVDVEPLGSDAAREIGTVTARTKVQPQQEVVGKYVVVWRKVGNDWKLATDIWNFNK